MNYMGWDYASTVADEVDRPQRTFPRALAGSVALVALTYVLPIAAVALTGLDANRWDTGGWADVARAVLPAGAAGAAVAFAVTVGGMLGAWGTLNAQMMQYSRLPAVMADDCLLPGVFARRHPRTGAPWVAISACAAAWVLCLGLSFTKLIVLDILLTGLSPLLNSPPWWRCASGNRNCRGLSACRAASPEPWASGFCRWCSSRSRRSATMWNPWAPSTPCNLGASYRRRCTRVLCVHRFRRRRVIAG